MTVSRRDLLLGTAGLAAGAAGGRLLGSGPALAQGAPAYKPEPGASLRVLRWTPFVKAEEDSWLALTKKFSDETGVAVRVDKESWEDIRPKAAVAANVGAGPDIMLIWFDDPFQYPDKLVDVTDIATAFAGKYGGYYPGLEGYAKQGNKFIALPLATIGNGILYRESMLQQAGWSKFPEKSDEFLEMCKALKAKSKPAGFALGKAVGAGNNFAHWIVWSHGGKMVDESGKVVINSPETIKALQYVRELYQTFIPGTESWLDINNNRAFLAGQVSLTANGVSLYFSIKNDPATAPIAQDTEHQELPKGVLSASPMAGLTLNAMVFKHSRYPNASKAFLQFMLEREQYDPWLNANLGYWAHPLANYDASAVWTSDPKVELFRNTMRSTFYNGYKGPLSEATGAATADYVMVQMCAAVASGQSTPEAAAREAERRARRYFRR
ncbi:MAG TPA: extracellular solute-binding protein [Microvirga sp.]|nr:extracellular solute-binding protein [Microvirga sp.]